MPDRAAYRGLVEQLFEADFRGAQAVWVEQFLILLVELRRVFGNDLDKVMILSAIGQQMLRDPAMPLIGRTEANTVGVPERSQRRTNIDALARATGIPRESVRRKVNELAAEQLVFRGEDGGIVVETGAAAKLAGATNIEVAMLDEVVAAFLARLETIGALRVSRPGRNEKD